MERLLQGNICMEKVGHHADPSKQTRTDGSGNGAALLSTEKKHLEHHF